MKKYRFVGTIGKTKYYVTQDGWMAKARNKKFIELGYIEDNWRTWVKLCD
jgi:hypothetical protein